jgi:hypothetical protein
LSSLANCSVSKANGRRTNGLESFITFSLAG